MKNSPPILINPSLVWDYDIPPESEQDEAFRRWYIARVLTRGRAEDLKAIGFDTIYLYLPALNLPAEIRRFWEWYFDQPGIQERFGRPDTAAAPSPEGDWSEPAAR